MTRPDSIATEIPGMMATLATYDGMFGPYHPQTLALATALAVALCASGRHADGRQLLERAVADLTRLHGRYHPARIRALDALFAQLAQDGDRRAALLAQRELNDCRLHLVTTEPTGP